MVNIISGNHLPNNRKKRNKMSVNLKNQIAEDITLIQKNWIQLDRNLTKKEYAFNYWVLNRIYDIDEEIIPDLITEYNDKSIDCYVHYEDSKELFIIQNKYYNEETPVNRKEISDFVNTPLITLFENRYTKSKELQKIFNTAKDDSEYKISLHFYVTNNRRNYDADSTIKHFNNQTPIKIKPLIRANLYYLDDIGEMYYGQSFKEEISFKFTLSTKVRGNILKILPEEYDLPEMAKAYYMLTPVYQLYDMHKTAKEKSYPLFEENIREYLGKSVINKGIIQTLKNPKDRNNFFYYNNGITIICKKTDQPQGNSLTLFQPQIINGCQTVNSINEVLSDYTPDQIKTEFNQVFVMVKVLLFDNKKDQIKPTFYKDIVKYTNRQNAINEKAFGAKKEIFSKIQNELKERGFLLIVKPSDRNTFTENYSKDAELNQLLEKANDFSKSIGIEHKKLSDLFIPLDKLLQVYLSFIKDGYWAFTKKDAVLKPTGDIYKEYSVNIHKNLTNDNIIRLYLIYIKAEIDRSESDDKKTPIPYYLIGFLGRFIKNKDKQNQVLQDLFGAKNNLFNKLFLYLEKLTNRYKKEYIENTKTEYNIMIKKPIDDQILDKQIEVLNDLVLDKELKTFFESLY